MKNAMEMEGVEQEIRDRQKELSDTNQKQLALARELYLRLHQLNPDEIDLNSHTVKGEIMGEWMKGGEKSLSVIFRNFETELKKAPPHHRYGNDILEITLDDLLYFKEHGELPPNWL